MILGVDKWLHFTVSFIVALWAPLFAALLGAGKEIWDLTGAGAAEAGDLIADALGILAALLQ